MHASPPNYKKPMSIKDKIKMFYVIKIVHSTRSNILSTTLILWAKGYTIVPFCLPFSQAVMQGYNFVLILQLYPPTNLFIAYKKKTWKNETMLHIPRDYHICEQCTL